ncbi:MAG: hypothetical protein VXY90_06090 [Pseudomonadota bacterium]|nr:hypothetical protein [Pseudomonadota bacterium]
MVGPTCATSAATAAGDGELATGSTATAALNTTAARKNAQAVLRALTDMGLSPDRVRLSAATAGDAASNEVRLFVR